MTQEGEDEIKITQEGEESMEEEMIQEGEKGNLKTKSLSSQLRHIRDICHEGIIRLQIIQRVLFVMLLYGSTGF